MRVSLAGHDFTSGALLLDVNGEYNLFFVPVAESFGSDYGTIELNRINVLALATLDDYAVYKACPNVIGLSNDLVSIVPTASQYDGELITVDNLDHFIVETF
jgi:hypothetical protein